MAYTEAQREATAWYNKKAYDRIDLVVKKGRRDEIKRFAAALGKSTNQFINDAIDRAMAEAADQ